MTDGVAGMTDGAVGMTERGGGKAKRGWQEDGWGVSSWTRHTILFALIQP